MKNVENASHQIQWFVSEGSRKMPRVTISKSGNLYIGQYLREQLLGKIRVGYLEKDKILIIEADEDVGFQPRKSGCIKMTRLSSLIVKQGISLPVRFVLEKQPNQMKWYGRITPKISSGYKASKKPCQFMNNDLFITHGYLIDEAVYRYGKSTPLDDRRSVATEAFFAAILEYSEGCGDFDDYIRFKLQSHITMENKVFTAVYKNTSLDTHIQKDGGNISSLYDLIPDTSDSFAAIDEQTSVELFSGNLPGTEQSVLRMLRNGYKIPEITKELHLSESKLQEICENMGTKWKQHID